MLSSFENVTNFMSRWGRIVASLDTPLQGQTKEEFQSLGSKFHFPPRRNSKHTNY